MATEESLLETLVDKRDSSGRFAPARADNNSNPQDKITSQRELVCHSEGARSGGEESLLSAKDFSEESLVAKRDFSAF